MDNKQMKLTEQDLQFIVENAVQIYLNENETDEGIGSGIRNVARGIGNGNFHMMQNYRSGSYAGSIQKYGQNAIQALTNFKGILNKSGAQQIVPQVEKINQELQQIISNYQNIAQQASNKQSVQRQANAQNWDTNPNNSTQGQNEGQTIEMPQNNAVDPTAPAQPTEAPQVNNGGRVTANPQQQRGGQQTISNNASPAQQGGRDKESFNSQYTNMGKMNLNNSKSPRKVMPESRSLTRLSQKDLRDLVYETVQILVNEDGGIVGDAAANASGFMNGANNAQTSSNAQFDLPFDSVQRKKIYSPKGSKSSKMTKVDMTPALKRKNGKGGSISINHVDESKVNNIINRSINNCLRRK